jgi:hypothetical protein
MKINVRQPPARLFGRAGESVTRSDRRERELEFGSPFPPLTARPNRRRDDALGLTDGPSPLGGAPTEQMEHENCGKTLTPVGHPFMTHSERRFAPTTVRQHRNGVRMDWNRCPISSESADTLWLIALPSAETPFRLSRPLVAATAQVLFAG